MARGEDLCSSFPPDHHLLASLLCPAPSPPPHETLCPTQSPFTWSHQLLGCPVPPAEVSVPPALPGGASQRCLAGLGGLGSLCFKSILSGGKEKSLQVGLQADQAEGTRQEGSFS